MIGWKLSQQACELILAISGKGPLRYAFVISRLVNRENDLKTEYNAADLCSVLVGVRWATIP